METGEKEMTRTIWKYPINKQPYQYGIVNLEVPDGAWLLKVDMQGDEATAWIEVDPAAVKTEYRFYIVGTGKIVPPDASRYVCTFFQGAFVWHVYE